MRRHLDAGLLAPIALLAFALAILPATPAFANATITIFNGNAAGVGFNDPTPAVPVGGNPGTTLGAQRLNAFQFAADIWGATLDSNVPIKIYATFEPLSCNATSATLGSAGTIFIWNNVPPNGTFPGSEFPNTWTSQALSAKRGGVDILTSPLCTNTGLACTTNADCGGTAVCTDAEIRARFNVNLGNAGCLTGIPWYLGFDTNHGPNAIDLVTVLLHEFGHGLGFQQFGSLATGALPGGLPDVYNRRLLDNGTGKTWNVMTSAERVASSINYGHLVWSNGQVNTEVPGVLAFGLPNLRVNAPGSIAGSYAVGEAQFGPALSNVGVSGDLVQALDAANAAGPTTFDACTAITNAGSVAGKIALVDRGTCGFIVKAANVQAAGAIAMVVADNAAGAPPAGLGGVDPTIVIPAVRITITDGNTIKAALASNTVSVTLSRDLTKRQGADDMDRAQFYAPNPVVGGSSVSHYDISAFPNQLMEPNINNDLTHNVTGVDLTLALMRDIGWFPDTDVDGLANSADNCPDVSNPGQADLDGDHLGDACDPDDDGDGVNDDVDNCPVDANSDQANNDGDAQGDVCDPDDDNDGVMDGADNCPFTSNGDQLDTDGDGLGNACDADDDGDGVVDGSDNCPLVANIDQADFDRDGTGDACDPLTGPPQDKAQCYNGNFGRFNDPRTFANQGLCVCYVMAAHGEKCPTIK
ncbi:MAG TPA: thrombospondin type 3 repeat-containing protein [Candidatus Polarisedimenticolia bacterium]|nr:thrombospondin type 3 repeat-containing protein [Candidatus Polarisedimenticolia bacterium]